MNTKRGLLLVATVGATLVAIPTALAHIERASYWPDPGFDKAGKKSTGGKVPKIRGLFSALNAKPVGDTRVVCKGKQGQGSIKRLRKSIKKANPSGGGKKASGSAKKQKKSGYVLRPSAKRVKVSEKQAEKLLEFNQRLGERCAYHSVQRAVHRSDNNDRVVIMPGVYTEPKSRKAPTNDPRCDHLEEQNDEGSVAALSYAYQSACPNDQNLIAVIGRAVGTGTVPQPPLFNRRGIPNLGACIRCNLQIEGSGLRPDDVALDAGRVASGNKGPANPVKDVVLLADRADGLVIRNLTGRHAAEHAFYILEVDGFRLDRFKAFYNEEYGVLTFNGDHGLISNCDAAGSGDAAIYPGSSADTGEQTVEPGGPRYSQELKKCDMHHSALGYSGTSGNAVHVHHNDFYDNALGFSSDVFTASGHPGFPQDSDLVENNEFYSNNFNPYLPGSDIKPTVPVPVGTGLWFAGGNNNTVRNNRFWDNWRRGTMLFAVPDAFVCPPDPDVQIPGCDPTPGHSSTSYRNRFHGNVMGRNRKNQRDPNGEDFWWDQQGLFAHPNTKDCWFDNIGADGTAASIESTPPAPFLPSDCNNAPAPGGGGFGQNAELLTCLANMDPNGPCPWFKTPSEPQ